MTGYIGTGKHGNKYHYYFCKGAKKKVCDKKTIRKDLIEERVVEACSKLLTEKKVKYIADQVYVACKKDGSLLSVKRLKTALKETESAIENLWAAMEKGPPVEMITERINNREAEKKELEKQLGIEIKKQSSMECSDILSFLDDLRLLPNDNEFKRRALINIFINMVYLHGEYFTLILSAGNRPLSVENIPLDDIEETFAADDVGCSSHSQLVADAPPKIAS
ncbi:MAG: zinc ribbon domain-containing protein [Oscillospiraceae bacterium]|nr:zinc ribbon domain-containing protein [Oscillospiraceae bacterium]